MLDVATQERRAAPDVASVYDAALARRDHLSEELAEPMAQPMQSMQVDDHEMTVLPLVLTPGQNGRLTVPTGDWSATIGLVERAAATIKAYERRFVQLDVHTRALMERAADDQARMQGEIDGLEGRLREAEERAARAEMSARDEAFYRWEADRRLREAEARLADAEDYARQSDDYLRRVHSALADL